MSTQDVTGADLFAPLRGSGNPEQEPPVERTSDAVRSGVGGVLPPVLDVCCGPRGMWFNKRDPRAMFTDRRRETIEMSYPSGEYTEVIDPDVVADFTELPFPDCSFSLVVMDPPHIEQASASGRIVKRYGHLFADWRGMLEKGFAECFRVLRPNGVFIFKWNECRIPVAEILALTPEAPLFGHQSGKTMQTHWVTFIKCGGSLPPELSGRGGTSERLTNQPAHFDGVHNTPHPRSCACRRCCEGRANGAIEAAMKKWDDDKRALSSGGGGAELGANVIERESESGAGSQNDANERQPTEDAR